MFVITLGSHLKEAETLLLSCVQVGSWHETLFSQAFRTEMKYVASGLSLVKARRAAKGNGCSRSRMDAFDFSNFENSIFFIGRDLQKSQCNCSCELSNGTKIDLEPVDQT